MTLREKQRLRRIIESNAREYRDQRRQIVQRLLSGHDGGCTPEFLAERRRYLSLHATAIAECVATLEEHVGADES